MLGEVFLAIIIDKLFTRFDAFNRIDKNPSPLYFWLAIGVTRVVNITGDILPSRSIDRLSRIHFKQIFASACVLLSIRESAPKVFDNALPFLERPRSKKTEPSARSPHPNSVGVCWSFGSHTDILRTTLYIMSVDFAPNEGKKLESVVDGVTYLRLPVKTRLIGLGDNLLELLEEYVRPHLQKDDLLFISEKIVCFCQNRLIRREEVKTSWLARLLASKVRNYAGTPQFRGLGHGTAEAMQLVIEEAGYPRVLFAAAVSAVTRPFGISGPFYFIIGKMAKSIDCPVSWTIEPYMHYAKRAPLKPDEVARDIKEKFGIETVIVDANYRGAFSLGKSTNAVSEKFIRELLYDNPAGQDSEMTPFFLVRQSVG